MNIRMTGKSCFTLFVLALSLLNVAKAFSQWSTNGSALYYNSGNVGIGTSSPMEKLHVAGNILSNKLVLNDPNDISDWNTLWQSGFFQSHNALNSPETGLNLWFWGINLNHSANNSSYRYNGQIAIKNSTIPTMYFRSTNRDGVGTWAKVVHSVGDQYISGKLGVGTSNPDSKLTVKGNVHAEEVKVDLSVPGPDYVFKEDYDLKSLEEVQNYINEHGHLPNIPSAKEMETNGIQLGEMNMKLLEKIEELMLYTLNQERKIKDQDIQIQLLKKQNQRLLKMEEKINNLIKEKQ